MRQFANNHSSEYILFLFYDIVIGVVQHNYTIFYDKGQGSLSRASHNHVILFVCLFFILSFFPFPCSSVFSLPHIHQFKGSVRPDKLGVVSGINRLGILWDCGAGHSFSTKLSRHLVFSVFPFPLSTLQSSGNEKNFRQNRVKLLLAPCLNIW